MAIISTIRNAEVAAKNEPAAYLLKCLVTTTVRPTVMTAATAAPTRFSVPPRATSASRTDLVPSPRRRLPSVCEGSAARPAAVSAA